MTNQDFNDHFQLEKSMSRLRILVLASFCDPEAVSMPYVAYCHAAALGKLHDVTIVIGAPVEEKVRRAKGPFRSIEVIRMPLLERIHAWCFRWIFRSNFNSQALTAFGYPFYAAFEWTAWRRLRRRILAREYDVVLRLLPVSAVNAGPFALLLRNGPIPFVVGPLNGGLPWPPGFSQLENEKQWVSGLRNLYRYFPFSRSTYRHAAAIMPASSQTWSEFSEYCGKLFFVPENGISSALCSDNRKASDESGKLKLVFVGGLVPRKACDLALRAAAALIRSGQATLAILGDGPERRRLEDLSQALELGTAVSFLGWVSHAEVLRHLGTADVLVFPSVRDFGGGVVFEALALGAVPLVVDFGGPGDIVQPEVGFKVALTNETEVVAGMEKILAEVAGDRRFLGRLQRQSICYARNHLTWEAKAVRTTAILNWVLGKGSKPHFPPPKILKTNDSASKEDGYCAFEN
jgi:glycosyltransferase involved in cell wall biosynthesis